MSSTIVYNQSIKRLDELKGLLQDNCSIAVASASLEALQRSISDLNRFAKSEVDPAKKEISLSRAKKLDQEASVLGSQIASMKIKLQEEVSSQRASLLGPPQEAPPTILEMDYFGKESAILGSSSDRVEEFIGLGKNALQDLYEQRDILKVLSTTRLNI